MKKLILILLMFLTTWIVRSQSECYEYEAHQFSRIDANQLNNTAALDQDGNLYTATYFNDSIVLGDTVIFPDTGYGYLALIMKFSSEDSLLWYKKMNATGGFSIQSVNIDPDGIVYFSGHLWDQIHYAGDTADGEGNGKVFVMAADTSGNFIALDNSPGEFENFEGANVNRDGGILITSTSLDSASSKLTVYKFDTAASFQIMTSETQSSGRIEPVKAVNKSGGGYYVAGTLVRGSSSSVSLGNLVIDLSQDVQNTIGFIAEADEQFNWQKVFRTRGAANVQYPDIAADAQGSVYFTGKFYGEARFGSDTLTDADTNFFIAKLSEALEPLYAKKLYVGDNAFRPFKNTSKPLKLLITDGNSEKGYVVGEFEHSLVLESGTVFSHGGFDVFIARFNEELLFGELDHVGSSSNDSYLSVHHFNRPAFTGAFSGVGVWGDEVLIAENNLDFYAAYFEDDCGIINTSVPMRAEVSEVVAYPNPVVNGRLNLKTGNASSIHGLTVYDASGRVIPVRIQNNSSSHVTVDFTGAGKGIYLVRFNVEGDVYTRKAVVR